MNKTLLSIALGVIAVCQPCVAQSGTMLTKNTTRGAKFNPKTVFVDHYVEKVVFITDASSGESSRDVVPSTFINATVTGNMRGIDQAALTGGTAVGITIGNFDHQALLSESKDWTAGAKKATFEVLSDFDDNGTPEDLSDDGTPVVLGTVTYSWTATILSVKIHITNGGTIMAEDSVGVPGAVNENTTVDLVFGPGSGSMEVTGRGRSTVATRRFGSGDNREEFEVSTVRLTGR
jgi:hypothetical protein